MLLRSYSDGHIPDHSLPARPPTIGAIGQTVEMNLKVRTLPGSSSSSSSDPGGRAIPAVVVAIPHGKAFG